jgi:hypothetical protein
MKTRLPELGIIELSFEIINNQSEVSSSLLVLRQLLRSFLNLLLHPSFFDMEFPIEAMSATKKKKEESQRKSTQHGWDKRPTQGSQNKTLHVPCTWTRDDSVCTSESDASCLQPRNNTPNKPSRQSAYSQAKWGHRYEGKGKKIKEERPRLWHCKAGWLRCRFHPRSPQRHHSCGRVHVDGGNRASLASPSPS